MAAKQESHGDSNMKIKAAIHKRCANCTLVRRKGRVYVTCTNPRHKQRQG